MTLSGDAGGIERGGVDTNTKGEDDQPQVSTDQRQGRRGFCRIRHAVGFCGGTRTSHHSIVAGLVLSDF